MPLAAPPRDLSARARRSLVVALLLLPTLAFARTSRDETLFEGFDSSQGWSASAGKIQVARDDDAREGGVLEWRYPVKKDAVFITTTSGLDRLRGAQSYRLRIRSDRAGRLAIRMDEKDGSAYYTRFDVGKSWTDVVLSNEDIAPVKGKRELDPDRVKRLYIVDLSGEEGWKGDRTVWIDSISTRSTEGPRPGGGGRPPAPADRAPEIDLPSSRTFYMGMTPWPYDFTPQAVEETYRFLGAHTDMVSHHLDDGVPWPEALDGKPYPAKVRENLDYRTGQLKGRPVYLAMTPISIGRDGLAGFWGTDSNMKRTGRWADKDFDDPDVVKAYVSFCEQLIEQFRPIFVNYGIEVNILREHNPKAFDRWAAMTGRVYEQLKAKHRDLPLFLSIHVDTFMKSPREQEEAIRKVLPYTDYIAVSSYPYGASAGSGGKTYADPKTLPSDWFRRIADLAPGKPFTVAETGFQAEDFVLKGKVAIPGNAGWQADYVRWLLREANALKARFVTWYVPRDYDPFWERLEKMGFPENFKTWRDTGLQDERGRDRPALGIWDAWRALPRR